jgi:hypothetical protein
MSCSCQRYVYLSKQYDFVWWIIIYFMLCSCVLDTLNNAPSMRLLLLMMRLRSWVDKDFIFYGWSNAPSCIINELHCENYFEHTRQ